MNKLRKDFYRRDDVVEIARNLVGKVLCTRLAGQPVTAGLIVETEAYAGRNDKACHANNGKRTDRTEVMYRPGGRAYVYLCYGIHHLFNVVTNREGKADAVLVRAIQPLEGIPTILERRKFESLTPQVSAGPGRLTRALGITVNHNGTDLGGNKIWIETRNGSGESDDFEIVAGRRIGVEYAGEHAFREWRFFIKDHRWVSR